jgi:hypothetical protein
MEATTTETETSIAIREETMEEQSVSSQTGQRKKTNRLVSLMEKLTCTVENVPTIDVGTKLT